MAVYPKVIKIQRLGRYKLYHFLLVAVLFFLAGCSTEKNTAFSRAYNNMTAHYNVYFNGKQSLLKGIEKIDNTGDDDYSKILPLYKSSNPSTASVASADMDNAILKASKLIQSHSITKKPKRRSHYSEAYKRFASREEFNNWVDDAYIMMGEAYFYKQSYQSAIENFSYVTRKFPNNPSFYDASIWLIRCYTELERYVEAYELIQQMQVNENFPKRLDGQLAVVTAFYYAKQKNYTEGIPFLTIGVKSTSNKQDRLRYKYVLAQWYEETGNHEKASETFREITRMNPPYKMAFNARISAAGTFTGTGDADKLRKELKKMLRDNKNVDFRDQIYFALGNISMKAGNKDQAIKEYTKSASLSSTNLYQRALSCLTLAQIYFDQPEYKKAQSYYDSAMVVIDDKYPNYQQISDRHKSLTRLTDNLYTVEREDSLQRIAQMDETSRNALISKWIKEATEKEAKAKQAEANQMMNRNFFRQNSRFGLGQQQTGSGWYFYNPTTVAYGKVEFDRIWGKRKLEDGWRLSNKQTVAEAQQTETSDSLLTEAPKVKKVSDAKTREYYTQDLPVNDSLMIVSNTKIKNSLYNAGRIFKTDFNDYKRSIESFEELDKRFPSNIYTLSSWFELWDLYNKEKNPAESNKYKEEIITKYPDSKYAKYLVNPNYFIELEARTDSINKLYQQAFTNYQAGDYARAGAISSQIINMKPDSVLVPKVKFLTTVAEGTATNRENFAKLLTGYITDYPKADPKPLAEKILKLIQDSTLVDYQKMVASGYLSDSIRNADLLDNNKKSEDEFGGKFSYDDDLLHYFVIAYPKNADLDLNRLKFDLANYNIDNYTKYDFDIETQNLNPITELLIVRALSDKEQGLIYFRSIIRQRAVFESLSKIKYVNFIISSTNFREITSEKNDIDYLKFFVKNYSHFITGNFTEELLPAPEVLMEKAKEEENALKEKGTYVTVAPTGDGLDVYSQNVDGAQNFVIAVNSLSANMKPLINAFDSYNRDQYKKENLAIQQGKIDDYQLMIIGPLKNKADGINYFTAALANRKLYRSLDTLSYRTFVITDVNLRKLTETHKLPEYLNYFKIKYINGETTGATKQTGAAAAKYNGPYKQDDNGVQSFVLIVPKEEVNAGQLGTAIKNYNSAHYAGQALNVTSGMLDDFRLMIKVEGLQGKQAGLDYLRAIAQDQSVYGPLQNASYRNFVITPANEAVFMKDKNILTYMEFYKQFYLK